MPSIPATPDPLSATTSGRRSTDGLHDLLGRFSRALAAGDVATVADAWDVPALAIGDQAAISFESRDEIERFYSASSSEYDVRGTMSPRVRVAGLERVGDRLATVRLTFPYLDRDEREVGEETSTLTLRRDDDGRWKIRVALMHGATSHHQ